MLSFFSFLLFSQIFGTEVLSEVDGNLIVWNEVTVPAEKTYETIVVLNGHLDLYGTTNQLVLVKGSAKVFSGARVEEKLVIVNGSLEREDGAYVPKDIDTESEFNLSIEKPWTDIKSGWENFVSSLRNASIWSWLAIPLVLVIPITLTIIIFLFAIIFFFIAPRFSKKAEWFVRKSPVMSMIWGLVGYFSFLPLVILLVISIVGIPIIPFFVLFALFIAAAGLFAGCRGIGAFILGKAGVRSMALATLLGILCFLLVLMIPFVGQLLGALVWIAGTGGIIRSFFSNDYYDESSVFEAQYSYR